MFSYTSAIDAPGGFLLEWWSVFWDIFIARTNEKHSEAAASYNEVGLPVFYIPIIFSFSFFFLFSLVVGVAVKVSRQSANHFVIAIISGKICASVYRLQFLVGKTCLFICLSFSPTIV